MNVLVDSDVVIDHLKSDQSVARYSSSQEITPYCSDVTLSEVVASKSLSAANRQALKFRLRSILRVIDHRDPTVISIYDQLIRQYRSQGLRRADALIAATAIAKKMPLWTKNRRHFERIEELEPFDTSTTKKPEYS